MTDIEIDKALALAIGWTKADFILYPEHLVIQPLMHVFSHKDWNVISPIAYRYDYFPFRVSNDTWDVLNSPTYNMADTPQKAIAMAVIGAKK